MTTTTSKITKVVAGLLGLVMVLTLVVGVTPARASTTDDINAILASIAQLQARLTTIQGGSSTSMTGGASCTFTFTQSLNVGSRGQEVMNLQKFLNMSPSTRVAVTGAGSPGNESTYFGPATRAAVMKFQLAHNIAQVGNVGPQTRGALNATCQIASNPGSGTPGGPVIPSGSALRVMLASDSPSSALVAGQAIGELAKFTFVNPTGAPISVTKLAFNRIGSSADSALSSVYLFQGGNRLTDAAGISSATFSFNSSNGIFTVPAGSSATISVRADIAASGTSGQLIGVQLSSVSASGIVEGTFPISGNVQIVSSATIGTVAVTYTGPTGASENPTSDVRVFEASSVVSSHAARLEAITFENRGSSDDNDIRNLRLFVDGNQVGSAVAQLTNGRATFDLSTSPVRLETGTRIIKVLADIVGGSGETYNIQIRRASDVRLVDVELGQPILITGTWAPGSANTIAAATLSVVRAANSPSTNISVGATNVKLATFEFRASGEDVKIETITVDADTTAGNGLDNGKVFLNGVQVGSTLDIGSASSETGTEFNFGSSFILKQGQIAIVDVYADAKSAAGTNSADGSVMDIGVSIAAADTEGVDSGDAVSAISEVEGFSRTVTASSLTMTKYSGYGNQTLIAGTNVARLGAFTLSAGSTEGVNVNTITVTLSAAEAATITDLTLRDTATGVTIGNVKASPSTSNSYSVNIAIPANGTKTIDLVGNIKSGSNIGSWIAAIDGSGTGAATAQSVTFGNSTTGTLQTITVGSGVLSAAVNAGNTPDSMNVIAGSSEVKVGSFRFTAQYSPYTVQEIKVKVPANAATSVSAVVLKYKDANGATQSSSQALALSSGDAVTYSTATYTGLSFFIPENTERDLDVYVSIPTVASGATSGAAISVVLDGDEGFKAIDSAGTSDTTLTGSTSDLASSATSGKGTMYVRKSVPTISAPALDSTVLVAGSDQVIARVNIAANTAGTVGWKKLVFTVNKTAAVTTGATTTLALWQGSNQIAGTFATTTGSLTGGLDSLSGLTTGTLTFIPTSEQEIPAGESRTYELKTTVGGLASGSSLSVSIANPSTSITTGTASAVGIVVGASTTSSFTWSDRSSISTVHSESTSDWTNDYLVKTLPITVGNRSVGF